MRTRTYAPSNTFASGPCGVIIECKLAPPGEKAPALASYLPVMRPDVITSHRYVVRQHKFQSRVSRADTGGVLRPPL